MQKMKTLIVYGMSFVLLGCALADADRQALNTGDAKDPPLFVVRRFMNVLRNDPSNTQAKMEEQMRVTIPEDIREYTAISLQLSYCNYHRFPGIDTPLALCQRFDKLGYPYFIEIADPGFKEEGKSRKVLNPKEIEEIFLNTRHCRGIETGETFWGYSGGDNPALSAWLMELLKICARHRKYFILGEGTWHYGHWTHFLNDHYAELLENRAGHYLIPAYKNTKPWAAHQTVSSIYGAWVTGVVKHYGLWNDPFVWMYSSFGHAGEMPAAGDYKKQANQAKMPYTFFLRQWLLGISQGATCSFAEHDMATTREGSVNDNFTRYLHPFIKGIGEHRMVPSREAVLKKTRAIINPFGTYQTRNGPYAYDPGNLFLTYLDDPVPFKPKSYDPFTVLYRNTYGFAPEYDTFEAAGKMFPKVPTLPDRLTRDTLPNSSRYYAIPIMPMKESQVPAGMKVLNLAELRSDQAVCEIYNTLYPDNPAGSTAYAVEVDNSFFVLNSSENTDVDQHYVFNLAHDPHDAITALSGDIGFQNILFGKREGRDDYWFQANGYVGDNKTEGQRYVCQPKPTVITFTCSRKPVIRAEQGVGGELVVVQEWTPQNKQITISCNHAKGAVNFRVK